MLIMVRLLMRLLVRLLARLLGWRGWRGCLLLGRLRLLLGRLRLLLWRLRPIRLTRFGRGERLFVLLVGVELLRLLGREILLGLLRIRLLLWSLVGRMRRRRLPWLLLRPSSRSLRFRGLHIMKSRA